MRWGTKWGNIPTTKKGRTKPVNNPSGRKHAGLGLLGSNIKQRRFEATRTGPKRRRSFPPQSVTDGRWSLHLLTLFRSIPKDLTSTIVKNQKCGITLRVRSDFNREETPTYTGSPRFRFTEGQRVRKLAILVQGSNHWALCVPRAHMRGGYDARMS
ncbi:hypothetical protein CXB51_019600 [Gossypium anomalum]|uniref:Uncharacterized protein n=1 Tax=Gossypium anomalum TaxID=47600 RepID=A0A8J6CWL2_9ROSI|nr:hypothetical protein CXB51_019600 [Gossypium anomalum]